MVEGILVKVVCAFVLLIIEKVSKAPVTTVLNNFVASGGGGANNTYQGIDRTKKYGDDGKKI